MVTGSLARRYARAILQIGEAKKNLDKLGADLRALGGAMKVSHELADMLGNPAVKSADRLRVIDALLARVKATPEARNTVHLLLDHGRLPDLPAISRELDAMIEARAGRISAEVVSAVDLTAAQVKEITRTLEQVSGKTVQLEKKKDPALLGGLVAKVGDVVYDGSVRTQLRALRDELAK
jgi:F-type H+-transporting ATPase subunit delta